MPAYAHQLELMECKGEREREMKRMREVETISSTVPPVEPLTSLIKLLTSPTMESV